MHPPGDPGSGDQAGWAVALMPLWAGVVLGLAEMGPPLAQLPPGVGTGTVVSSCMAFGLWLSLPLALLLWLLREGTMAVGRGMTPRRGLALGWGLASFATGAFLLIRWLLAAGVARPELGAGLALVALACWGLVSVGVARAVMVVLARLQRAALPSDALGASALAAVIVAELWVLLPSWWTALASLPRRALWLAGVWLLAAAALSGSKRYLPMRWLRRLAPVPLAIASVLTPLALAGLARGASSRASLQTHTVWVGAVVSWLAAASDRDGDGHASRLGGGDCDDRDGDVHPGAIEVLGNDRDEDCDGEALIDDPTVGTLDGRLHGEGCEQQPLLPKGTNVLLVVVDALRADRVGGERNVMPNLARFAQHAVRFERCYTPHPSTAYALPALFTGLHTRWARDLLRSQSADIPDSRALPQTLLAHAGYRSAAVYGHFLAGHRHAMTRGIERRALRVEAVTAEAVVDDTLRFVDEMAADGEPFFSYAHFYDPHWEYLANDAAPWPQSTRADRYDGELFRVDRALGRLLAALEQRSLLAHTLVVVVSDHGEEMGEHGGEFHGQTMFEEVVRVPCLMAHPTLASRVVSQPVSLVDVLPTMLSLLGVEHEAPMQGVSLGPLMLSDRCRRGPVVGEMQPWRLKPPFKPWLWYLVDGDEKLIVDVERDTAQLFDLARDPGEQHNLVELEPERAERMRRTMAEAIRSRIALPIGSEARRRLAF